MTEGTRAITGELLNESRGAVMTTITPEGIPESRMIFNFLNEREFPGLKSFFREPDIAGRLLFGTNTSLEKIAQLKRDSKLTVYYSVPEKFMGMMEHGEGRILDDSERQRLA